MSDFKQISEIIKKEDIPPIIYNDFCKHGDEKSEHHYTDKNGTRKVKYGNLLHPFRTTYNYDNFSFKMLEKYYNININKLEKGYLFNTNGTQLNKKSIEPFFKEYSKGFLQGYNDFGNNLKSNDSIFKIKNKQIAHKVYSRIRNFKKGYGQIPINLLLESEKLINKIQKKYKDLEDEHLIEITSKEDYFNGGYNGGEFYKAWELILSKPTIFKPFFEKDEKKEKEPQKEEIMKVKWNGTKTEFIELVKALIESKILVGNQKDIINNLSEVFDIPIKYPDQFIQDIKGRNIGSETLFIDKLKSNLYNYITKENTP